MTLEPLLFVKPSSADLDSNKLAKKFYEIMDFFSKSNYFMMCILPFKMIMSLSKDKTFFSHVFNKAQDGAYRSKTFWV